MLTYVTNRLPVKIRTASHFINKINGPIMKRHNIRTGCYLSECVYACVCAHAHLWTSTSVDVYHVIEKRQRETERRKKLRWRERERS